MPPTSSAGVPAARKAFERSGAARARTSPRSSPPSARACRSGGAAARAFGRGRLAGADLELAEDLARVGAHDLGAEPPGEFERDLGLAGRGRADDATTAARPRQIAPAEAPVQLVAGRGARTSSARADRRAAASVANRRSTSVRHLLARQRVARAHRRRGRRTSARPGPTARPSPGSRPWSRPGRRGCRAAARAGSRAPIPEGTPCTTTVGGDSVERSQPSCLERGPTSSSSSNWSRDRSTSSGNSSWLAPARAAEARHRLLVQDALVRGVLVDDQRARPRSARGCRSGGAATGRAGATTASSRPRPGSPDPLPRGRALAGARDELERAVRTRGARAAGERRPAGRDTRRAEARAGWPGRGGEQALLPAILARQFGERGRPRLGPRARQVARSELRQRRGDGLRDEPNSASSRAKRTSRLVGCTFTSSGRGRRRAPRARPGDGPAGAGCRSLAQRLRQQRALDPAPVDEERLALARGARVLGQAEQASNTKPARSSRARAGARRGARPRARPGASRREAAPAAAVRRGLPSTIRRNATSG